MGMSDEQYRKVVEELTSTNAHKVGDPMTKFLSDTLAGYHRTNVMCSLSLIASSRVGATTHEEATAYLQRIGDLVARYKSLPLEAFTRELVRAVDDAYKAITPEASTEDVRRWLDYLEMSLLRAGKVA